MTSLNNVKQIVLNHKKINDVSTTPLLLPKSDSSYSQSSTKILTEKSLPLNHSIQKSLRNEIKNNDLITYESVENSVQQNKLKFMRTLSDNKDNNNMYLSDVNYENIYSFCNSYDNGIFVGVKNISGNYKNVCDVNTFYKVSNEIISMCNTKWILEFSESATQEIITGYYIFDLSTDGIFKYVIFTSETEDYLCPIQYDYINNKHKLYSGDNWEDFDDYEEIDNVKYEKYSSNDWSILVLRNTNHLERNEIIIRRNNEMQLHLKFILYNLYNSNNSNNYAFISIDESYIVDYRNEEYEICNRYLFDEISNEPKIITNLPDDIIISNDLKIKYTQFKENINPANNFISTIDPSIKYKLLTTNAIEDAYIVDTLIFDKDGIYCENSNSGEVIEKRIKMTESSSKIICCECIYDSTIQDYVYDETEIKSTLKAGFEYDDLGNKIFVINDIYVFNVHSSIKINTNNNYISIVVGTYYDGFDVKQIENDKFEFNSYPEDRYILDGYSIKDVYDAEVFGIDISTQSEIKLYYNSLNYMWIKKINENEYHLKAQTIESSGWNNWNSMICGPNETEEFAVFKVEGIEEVDYSDEDEFTGDGNKYKFVIQGHSYHGMVYESGSNVKYRKIKVNSGGDEKEKLKDKLVGVNSLYDAYISDTLKFDDNLGVKSKIYKLSGKKSEIQRCITGSRQYVYGEVETEFKNNKFIIHDKPIDTPYNDCTIEIDLNNNYITIFNRIIESANDTFKIKQISDNEFELSDYIDGHFRLKENNSNIVQKKYENNDNYYDYLTILNNNNNIITITKCSGNYSNYNLLDYALIKKVNENEYHLKMIVLTSSDDLNTSFNDMTCGPNETEGFAVFKLEGIEEVDYSGEDEFIKDGNIYEFEVESSTESMFYESGNFVSYIIEESNVSNKLLTIDSLKDAYVYSSVDYEVDKEKLVTVNALNKLGLTGSDFNKMVMTNSLYGNLENENVENVEDVEPFSDTFDIRLKLSQDGNDILVYDADNSEYLTKYTGLGSDINNYQVKLTFNEIESVKLVKENYFRFQFEIFEQNVNVCIRNINTNTDETGVDTIFRYAKFVENGNEGVVSEIKRRKGFIPKYVNVNNDLYNIIFYWKNDLIIEHLNLIQFNTNKLIIGEACSYDSSETGDNLVYKIKLNNDTMIENIIYDKNRYVLIKDNVENVFKLSMN